jgi:hypothetical protein
MWRLVATNGEDPSREEGNNRPEKPRKRRENRNRVSPKPKKTPNLACCAVGKKSKLAEISGKAAVFHYREF